MENLDDGDLEKLFSSDVEATEVSLNGAHQNYRITHNSLYLNDLLISFKIWNDTMRNLMNQKLNELHNYKINFIVNLDMKKPDQLDLEHRPVNFITRAYRVHNENDIDNAINNAIEEFQNRIELFNERGSGYVVQRVNNIELAFNQMNPLQAGSYVELPKFIKDKHACINVKNKDNKCFMWSVLSALHPQDKDSQRVSKYQQYLNNYDFNFEFPMKIKDVKSFEKRNDTKIIIISYEDQKFNVAYNSAFTAETEIPLLLYKNHFCWIKDISRLLASTVTNKHQKYCFCLRCLQHFSEELKLDEHKKLCNSNSIKTVLPIPEKAIMKFKNYLYQYRLPFALYVDFECLVIPHEKFDKQHKACSFAIQPVSIYKNYKPYLFRGTNSEGEVIERFYEKLAEYCTSFQKILNTENPINMTKDDEIDFQTSTCCYICKNDLNNDKARDHDHFTGKYRGAAHNQCNLNIRKTRYRLPIIIHNMKGYDSHLFVKKLDKLNKIAIIAKTMEKYIKIKGEINGLPVIFIDSNQFLALSLESLVKNLQPSDFK